MNKEQKKKLMEEDLAGIPEVPEGFIEMVAEHRRNENVMWYRKKGGRATYVCGQCGEEYELHFRGRWKEIEEPVRDNQEKCRKCGSISWLKPLGRTNRIFNSGNYYLWQRQGDALICRIWEECRWRSPKTPERVEFNELGRAYYEPNKLRYYTYYRWDYVKTVKPAKKEEKKEEKKKGMEEDPYWKNLGKELKEEKGADKSEEIQKNEEEEHSESTKDAGAESDEKAVPDNEECSTSVEEPVEDAGRASGDIIESDEESGAESEEPGGKLDRDIRNDMPVSVARQRLKGWIADIINSAADLQKYFDYENYDMAIKVTTEIEKEIFEIEKLLRNIRRKHDEEDMDGSDT